MVVSRSSTRTRSGRRQRPTLALVVLVLAALTVVSLGFRGRTGRAVGSVKSQAQSLVLPLESTLTRAGTPVVRFFQGALSYGSLRAQNARLRNEVTRLRAEAGSSAVLQQELAKVDALDHLHFAQGIPSVAAQVVAQSPSNFQLSEQLDVGSRQGVRVGMPVVAGSGLVGRIVGVSSTDSTMLLLSDPTFAVGVRLGTSGVLGVASGGGAGSDLSVDYVQPGTKLRPGAFAVTALVKGGTFPAGIPVGKVVSATSGRGALQEQVRLAPLVNPASVQLVRVLRWTAAP